MNRVFWKLRTYLEDPFRILLRFKGSRSTWIGLVLTEEIFITLIGWCACLSWQHTMTTLVSLTTMSCSDPTTGLCQPKVWIHEHGGGTPFGGWTIYWWGARLVVRGGVWRVDFGLFILAVFNCARHCTLKLPWHSHEAWHDESVDTALIAARCWNVGMGCFQLRTTLHIEIVMALTWGMTWWEHQHCSHHS